MDASSNRTGTERRRVARERTFLPGQIGGANALMKRACTVAQMSAHGARLQLADGAGLADEFPLFIPQRDLRVRARIVWRDDHCIGVEFVAPDSAAAIHRCESRVAELEADNARLRARVGEMQARLQLLTDT